MTVIYIDDDSEDREVFKEIIEEIDPAIQVHLVSSCADLGELLQSLSNFPDYIFADFLLSGMSGEDCMIKLKADDAFKQIPVVMLSGIVDNNSVERFISNGAHSFIQKTGIYFEYKESIEKVIKAPR